MEGISARIKQLVDVVGSQRALAKLVHVTPPTVTGWIAGSRPYESTLHDISERTGVSFAWLRDGIGDDKTEMMRLRLRLNAPGNARARLRLAREMAGLTVDQLAKQMGYPIALIQAIEGGSQQISENVAINACRVLPLLRPEDLMEGSDSAPIVSEGTGTRATYGTIPPVVLGVKSRRYVPLISRARAGMLQADFVDDIYEYEGMLSINVEDPKAFAVEIEGDSMEPRISEGDKIIAFPNRELRDGSVVIARTVDGDVLCKLFHRRDGGKRLVLTSYNPAYPPRELSPEEVVWIYPVGQVVREL